MPNLTIYLNADLYEFVKDSASKTIQDALIIYRQEISKNKAKDTKK